MFIAAAAIGAQSVVLRLVGEPLTSSSLGRRHRFAVNLLIAAISAQIAFATFQLSAWIRPSRPEAIADLGFFYLTLLISAFATGALRFMAPDATESSLNPGDAESTVLFDSGPGSHSYAPTVVGWVALSFAAIL